MPALKSRGHGPRAVHKGPQKATENRLPRGTGFSVPFGAREALGSTDDRPTHPAPRRPMSIKLWLNLALVAVAFPLGALLVHRWSRRVRRYRPATAARSTAVATASRPASQLPVRSYDELLQFTSTAPLIASIARRARLSQDAWARDCEPALQAFAEFVQCLPASECHHHAQPGGLWVHALEVVDAALTFRAGAELPPGVSVEDRKRLEHRWTYGVFAAALLHDVGKPVTDVAVTLYKHDPRLGQPWTPLSGPMRASGARWYSVSFGDPGKREYEAHSKLGGMLLQSFVPAHALRWLGEDGTVLDELVSYLLGEAPDGVLGSLVKRADSDSVRRNLLQGPRTRFASARSVPLIDRLMTALRRMVVEGGQLPLNRPGAAGWVHDGHVWFVCARLADEVRTYLATHESAQGIPGKDRNDRLFDTWQEYGAARIAPDGGAIWRVRVECDGWSPPDPLTVLCFALGKVYEPGREPAPMRGRVLPVGASTVDGHAPAAAAPAPVTDAATRSPEAVAQEAQPVLVQPPRVPATSEAAAALPRPEGSAAAPTALAHVAPPAAAVAFAPANAEPGTMSAPAVDPSPARVMSAPAAPEPSRASARDPDDDRLDPADTAALDTDSVQRVATTPQLGAPLRPKQKGQRPAASVAPSLSAGLTQRRSPSPAATAFMAWVAQAVGSGELPYNQEGAMVHFCARGALLLSPEIFRRFFAACEALVDGPVADLRASHGERAFARLQNELAKSGWTVRNGDENLHYYAFVKADGTPSRTASFYLVGQPELFWNPVPPVNERIRAADRPKKMTLPASAQASSDRPRRSA